LRQIVEPAFSAAVIAMIPTCQSGMATPLPQHENGPSE
jgi:hypothetical protein